MQMISHIPQEYFEKCQEKYGEKIQTDITIEELAELSTACTKLIQTITKMSRRSDQVIDSVEVNPFASPLMDNFIEEMADVRIMTEQIAYTKGVVRFINNAIESKLSRED